MVSLRRQPLAASHPDLRYRYHPSNVVDFGSIYANTSRKFKWFCEEGHLWEIRPLSLYLGNGCPYCEGRKVLKGTNDLVSTSPNLMKTWDFELNTVDPRDVREGSGYRAHWKCFQGHRWVAPIANRARGLGCPYCANKKVLPGYNDFATVNPELLEEWDFSKNNVDPYRDITAKSNKKVHWVCAQGHEWIANVKDRAKDNGDGCGKCSGKSAIPGITDILSTHPDMASEWDYDKNSNIDITTIKARSSKQVWWLCSDCGTSYQSRPEYRVRSQRDSGTSGCPHCSGRKPISGINDLASQQPELMEEWDWERNVAKGFNPANITEFSHAKIHWICSEGHRWVAEPHTRSYGYARCTKCHRFSSVPEDALRELLVSSIGPDSDSVFPIKWASGQRMAIDFVFNDLCVEYDGCYYHRGDKASTDLRKSTILLESGYKVVRVREQTINISLDSLGIVHPNYFEVNFHYKASLAGLDKVAQQIVDWYQSTNKYK